LLLRHHWQNFCVGISLRQFEQMKDRVNGKSPRTVIPVGPAMAAGRADEIILGIDPSLRGTGYGIIRMTRPCPETLAHDTISCPAHWERSRCLAHISEILGDVILEHAPTVCVVEGLFYAQNMKTALIMGEARGASIVATAQAGLEVFEISPRKMKLAIVGYGAAQKSAVAKMVQRFLHLNEEPDPDAADALALAIAFAQEVNRFSIQPPKKV
jgi:crossover junction endodeoxyribonuclease RuvC